MEETERRKRRGDVVEENEDQKMESGEKWEKSRESRDKMMMRKNSDAGCCHCAPRRDSWDSLSSSGRCKTLGEEPDIDAAFRCANRLTEAACNCQPPDHWNHQSSKACPSKGPSHGTEDNRHSCD